jgi:hypothetical protein
MANVPNLYNRLSTCFDKHNAQVRRFRMLGDTEDASILHIKGNKLLVAAVHMPGKGEQPYRWAPCDVPLRIGTLLVSTPINTRLVPRGKGLLVPALPGMLETMDGALQAGKPLATSEQEALRVMDAMTKFLGSRL